MPAPGARSGLGVGPAARVADVQLAVLVRTQAPLRRVLARIAGRFVEKKSWERLGFARLSDWARERAGLSARAVYDLAHVDAALARLPHVEAAFVAGEIPWSKARLLCRVAQPSDEARWVAFARRTSVHALEREVRAVDRGSVEAGAHEEETDEDGALVWPRKTVEVRCTPWVHGRWYEARKLARRVAGEPLPPWACMEAVVAEVLSALPLAAEAIPGGRDPAAGLDAARNAAVRPTASPWLHEASEATAPASAVARTTATLEALDRDARATATRDAASLDSRAAPTLDGVDPDAHAAATLGGSRVAHAPARTLRTTSHATGTSDAEACDAPPSSPPQTPASLRELGAGLEEADAFALDARFRRVVALEQRVWAQAGALLSQIAAERAYLGFGHRSLETYARERLGISPRKARALLRLERAGALCPELRAAYRDGRLSWVQALVLLPIIVLDSSLPFRGRWIAHAAQVTVRRLDDEVEHALAFESLEPPDERHLCAKPMLAGGDTSPADADSADTDGAADNTDATAPPVPPRRPASSSPARATSRSSSRRRSAPCAGTSSARSVACRPAARRSTPCSSTPSRPGARRSLALPASTASSSAMAGAARRRAAPRTATSTTTTWSSAARGAATHSPTAPRSARGTTCGACTRA